MADDDREQLYHDFDAAVNMTPAALEKWLDGEDSRRLGRQG